LHLLRLLLLLAVVTVAVVTVAVVTVLVNHWRPVGDQQELETRQQ
jgi:hypothetical protein